jgi:hypothetical protein
MLKLARWDEDAIIHDPLRMRITNQTKPNLFTTHIGLFEFWNWRMAGRKFMKFCMDVMSQVATRKSDLITSYTM